MSRPGGAVFVIDPAAVLNLQVAGKGFGTDLFNPTLEQNLSKSALSFWSTLAAKVVRAI